MAMNISSSGGRGRRGRRGGANRAPMAEINVTPFVDVMLVLLIIFMVTAPLLVSGVPVDLPDSRANALDQQKDPVEVSIDREGAFFVDGNAVAPADLGAAFDQIAVGQSADNPRQITVRADKEISYGRIMMVMGELNRAGLNSVNLVTNTAATVTAGSSGTE
ncbi:protein TolR [Sphingorhabdus arenilitoris]|uniref:Protein TolR n=1 Tax=Sphingorhabdus arenilitoris TaxID=1490041 RepID=A0ABV8RIT9_9SPHN